MSDDRIPPGGLPEHALLRERMRKAAEERSIRNKAKPWKGKTPEERLAVVLGLMNLGAMLVRSRGRPVRKPPLNFPRFSSRGEQSAGDRRASA